MAIFYRPADAVAADFIPFYWAGQYHLFYLKDWRDPAGHGEGTPWYHLVTRDFVTFEEWGEAIPRGTKEEQDLFIFTGSVFERNGTFHIFYTGHNPHRKALGQPEQAVNHATSPDLRTWTKDPAFQYFAPKELGYEPHDWRDPFIYWDARYQEYGMLLAARKTSGPPRLRGCVALATSPDLATWQVRDPFWAPDIYYTHECPDLFQIGDWWYLVYSTFSERCVTHYRLARSQHGPWLAPANDTFDGRAYYAAKTASDGQRRYVFGWLPTRNENKDDGWWQWGGDLVVHELYQQPDGTLAVRVPASVAAAFPQAHALSATPLLGQWSADGRVDATARHALQCYGALPDEALVEATITCQAGTVAAGLQLRTDVAKDTYYQVRLEPARQRLVIDRWPRGGDQPFMLERPLAQAPGVPVHLQVFVSGTNLVVYADGHTALSCRMYNHRSGTLAAFATEGRAQVSGLTLKTRAG